MSSLGGTARIQGSLQITVGNLNYLSRPSSFAAVVNKANGPTPGAMKVPTHGVDVDFSELTAMGGLCRLMNLDSTNFVTYGILDGLTSKFYPLGELGPGETYILRLSRDLGTRYGTGSGTGSGSHPTGNETLHMRADLAPCIVLVEAFDP